MLLENKIGQIQTKVALRWLMKLLAKPFTKALNVWLKLCVVSNTTESLKSQLEAAAELREHLKNDHDIE